MKALTITPGRPGSLRLREIPEPPVSDGPVLVEPMAVGVCGTDREIAAGEYGEAPDGADHLVIGHESLGRVVESRDGSDLAPGDLVVGIVRRPDPVPCVNCAVGEWDMCRNGRYTERSIKGLHGYASQRFRLHPEFAVRLDPALDRVGVLVEPTSVVAKAWEHVERIGNRAAWSPRKVLVTGAGPIGLLAALLAVQRGLAVQVLDRVESGPKPHLVADLGADYRTDIANVEPDADIVIECTGAGALIVDVMAHNAHNAVVCLTGVSPRGRQVDVDVGALNRGMVLQNDVVFGSVNANRRHYEQAVNALLQADAQWLERLITRRVPWEQFGEALDRRDDDVKVILEIGS